MDTCTGFGVLCLCLCSEVFHVKAGAEPMKVSRREPSGVLRESAVQGYTFFRVRMVGRELRRGREAS